MAKKKKAANSSRGKNGGDKSAKTAQGADGVLRTNDIVAEQGIASDDFVASMPHNSIKELEHGHDNAVAPPAGETIEPDSSALTASTSTEETVSEKTGGAAPLGTNATVAPLDRVRVDASDQPLTTNQGVRIADNQNTLKAGLRGPSLLEDFILREKITHFDHERIPERIVHARGSGAHGFFEAYDALTEYTRAAPFAEKGKITPVFARFSTVLGERGSKDTARDARGFAVKFYTDEGNWDLVGNNIPVFFIQDAMKFPDLVHAAKPEPHHAMPQAGSGARHVLGLRLIDAGVHPHADVGDVGSRDSAQLPDDAGLRRAYLPTHQRAG
jgi:catalase